MGSGDQCSGKILKFEKAAMSGDPMPKGLRGLERIQYLTLSHLYRLYHSGSITREEAVAEKRLLMKDCADAERIVAFDKRMMESMVNLWVTIGYWHGRYARERTLENADNLSKAIYGLLRSVRAKPENRNGMDYCPRCGKLFNPQHAASNPRYCEDCGIPLKWEDDDDGEK